jgi:hypothetical protein
MSKEGNPGMNFDRILITYINLIYNNQINLFIKLIIFA